MQCYGSDAQTNLANSIRLIHKKHKELKGVFAVFNSQIISGANLFKISEESFSGFGSRTTPIRSIGVNIILNKKLIQMNKELFSGEKPSCITNLPVDKIFCVTESPGLNKQYLKAVIDSGVKGIIWRSYGVGDPSKEYLEIFDILKERKIPIIMTTQIKTGSASMDVNEPGILAKKHGVIPAYRMSLPIIWCKMAYLFEKGYKYEDFFELMNKNLKGELV